MTSVAAPLSLAPSGTDKDAKRRLPVLPVAALLKAQQSLTAVERFAKKHDAGEVPEQEQYYRELIPHSAPRPGEQYAFEVDLDACTGCKACVAGCHTLNGLDEGEMWRSVGLLQGGTPGAPAIQTVTTSCHHCVEPACMAGCPTQAYEKDPVTGIVKHLDDQCFGCQYCTLMCPYDAPKYSKQLGIVRKCDMCTDRLQHGEAPACVQACPNEAIAIRVVERQAAIDASNAQTFLPGAPAPDHTVPTTIYKTQRPMPSNMLPADFFGTSPEHSHPPLVVMLTLTQLAVGAFTINQLVERLFGSGAGSPLAQTAFACAFALLALGASVFHLGRPLLAWRAVLGLRTSWLSREALAFGGFAQFGVLYGVLAAAPLLPAFPGKERVLALSPAVQSAASAIGVVGVFCSVMVYVATRREQWSGTQTGVKFFGTTILLGAAAVATIGAFTGSSSHVSGLLISLLIGGSAVKLMFEASVLRHSTDRRHSVHKRMALLMLHDLRTATVLRFVCCALGGILLPSLLTLGVIKHGVALTFSLSLVLLLTGELAERYLFFSAAPASRMPGGIR